MSKSTKSVPSPAAATAADEAGDLTIETLPHVRREIEAEFTRIGQIVAVAGVVAESDGATDYARAAAGQLLTQAVEDLEQLFSRVHVALGGTI